MFAGIRDQEHLDCVRRRTGAEVLTAGSSYPAQMMRLAPFNAPFNGRCLAAQTKWMEERTGTQKSRPDHKLKSGEPKIGPQDRSPPSPRGRKKRGDLELREWSVSSPITADGPCLLAVLGMRQCNGRENHDKYAGWKLFDVVATQVLDEFSQFALALVWKMSLRVIETD
ncbi:hypothetical protein CRENBAI_019688 [Crenichthys baileyi]|uniref:Uncharacterized protein n=1 Tax=Crenichthys baileyi TaxID=28760 RepID=A0AAV9QZX3_9TELE